MLPQAPLAPHYNSNYTNHEHRAFSNRGVLEEYYLVLEESGLETLAERRTKAVTQFAVKTSMNPRYSERWFPRNGEGEHNLRRREEYRVDFAAHERLRNAPIHRMRRILNEVGVGA